MQEHKLWLSFAENDLKTATIALRHEIVLSSAFFLTQQCAEKALKAYLIFHEKPIRKIHDLVEILKDCIKIDSDFQQIKRECEGLTPFVTTYRYPDSAFPFPDKTTLEISIKEAKRVLEFVKYKI